MASRRHPSRQVAITLRPAGFSLIEMLISLAIIIILFTMMFGFGSRQHQLNQKQKCEAQLQKLFISLQIYANEHDQWFPQVTNAATSEAPLGLLVPKYCADASLFTCPGSKDKPLPPGTPLTEGRISYAYYMGRRHSEPRLPLLSDRQIDTKPKVPLGQVFSDDGDKPGNNHHQYGGAFLFNDGSTEITKTHTPVALPLGTNVVLLNPKP